VPYFLPSYPIALREAFDLQDKWPTSLVGRIFLNRCRLLSVAQQDNAADLMTLIA